MILPAFLAALLALGQHGAKFPQDESPLRNQTATHELFVTSDETTTDAHTLYLRHLASSTTTPILAFGRWIEVHWSPDGKRFFVNDWVGSNRATCRVAELAGGGCGGSPSTRRKKHNAIRSSPPITAISPVRRGPESIVFPAATTPMAKRVREATT